MMILLSLTSFVLAVICYTVSQLQQHGKLKWMSKDPLGFWGENMDKRKYKNFDKDQGERWPTSTSITVFLTDGYHLMQFCFKIFLCASFIPYTGWQIAVALWVTWGIVFTVFYKLLSR